jgi:hypothetical protein
VLEHLRKLGLGADRVVLTSYATADVRKRCHALGASRVFDKAGDIDALIEHCQQLADQHLRLPPPGGAGAPSSRVG